MSNASNFLEDALLNHFFRNTAATSPSQVFLALYKTDPTDFDTGQEVSGGGYARQPITFNAPIPAGSVRSITNAAAIQFPEATADWTTGNETVGFWGIRTALTGGNLLAYGEFKDEGRQNDGKYPVTRFDQFIIPAGRIVIQFNNRASNWLRNAALNHFFRNTAVTGASQVFLGLYISDPTADDVGIEVSYTGYQRQAVSFDAPSQTGGAAVIRNSTVLNFPIPDIDVGSVAFFGIRSAATGGNLLCFAPWTVAKDIFAGMQFSVTAGNLEVSMQ